MDTTELLKLALTCSVVKPQNIAKHFSPAKTITGPEDIIVIAQEEWQAKRILGFILACSTLNIESPFIIFLKNDIIK